METLRILSLGAGVQSSTLAMLIEKGKIPMVDAAIFADTGAEPKEVLEWLEWLKTKVSYPIHVVQKGNLRDDLINSIDGKYKFLVVPLYTVNAETGKKGMLRRQCTSDYKILPVNQKVRELLGLAKGEKRKKGTKVSMMMGISYDEMSRMKINPVKYITNEYPLVDIKWGRKDCIKWFEENLNKTPPRSACTFCPYKSNKEWLETKKNKEEWDKVVELDALLRQGTRNDDQVFLHRSCKPIDEVDFENEKNKKQLDFEFGIENECEGMCGI